MNAACSRFCKVLLPAAALVLAACLLARGGPLLEVKKIYSGNAIKVTGAGNEKKRIRYIGVDAPGKGKAFYALCRDANRRLVDNRSISILTDRLVTGPDGRMLCYVYAGDVFVNAALIQNGFGLAHIQPPNSRHAGLFLSLQREARKNHRGLWAHEDFSDEPYYVGSKSKNMFHRPSCFHAKNLSFDDRVIFRTKDEALNAGFTQDWRCCPLFVKPDAKKQ